METYSVKTVRFLYRYLIDNHYNPSLLLINTGLNLSQIEDPDARMTRCQKETITENILSTVKDPLVGLKMGSAFRLDDFGTLGYAALCAKTRGDSLKIIIKLQILTVTEFNISTEINENSFSINFHSNRKKIDDSFIYNCDLETAAVVFCEGKEKENKKALIKVKLMHSQHHLKAQYEKFYGCPVEFDQPYNEIVFKRAYFDEAMPRADVQTSEICLAQCKKIMADMNRQSNTIENIREIMLAKAGGFPSISEVATQLKTTERTLRRRLKSEQTSFQEILNNVRTQLAKEYLTTELSIEQIAELIGYSEPANFSNAFKRWTLLSPTEYRQSLV